MISSILILAALATGAAAETFSGKATYNDVWSDVACGGAYDITKYLIALNHGQFGTFPNPNNAPVCGNTITVDHGGKSLVATVVDRGAAPMEMNNFDLNIAAFEHFAPLGDGHFEVTWSWNDGFDPAIGTQNKAGLVAVALGGEVGGGDTSAAVTSPVAAVGTSIASTLAAETSPIAAQTTALAAGVDTAPLDSSAAVSSAAASTSVESTAGSTGDRRGGRQSKRCAAQL